MVTPRKFWLILAAVLTGFVILACSCSNLSLPFGKTPTPSEVPSMPTLAYLPTPEPFPTNGPTSLEGLAGSWLDPDTSTVTTIQQQGDGYVVVDVSNPNRGGNELVGLNWDGSVLSWTYCVPGGACVTSQTISVSGDSLYVSWSNDQGISGYTTMERTKGTGTSGPGTTQPGTDLSYQDMIGKWLDPDSSGTVTTIMGLDGGLAVESVINPNRGGNELTEDNWDGSVLTWTYCIPNGSCVTSQTVYVDGDSLYTLWTDDQGNAGVTTLQRQP
jgi:hypothetical protein